MVCRDRIYKTKYLKRLCFLQYLLTVSGNIFEDAAMEGRYLYGFQECISKISVPYFITDVPDTHFGVFPSLQKLNLKGSIKSKLNKLII